MSVILVCPLLEVTSTTVHIKFVPPMSGLLLMVSKGHKPELSCQACFKFSRLRPRSLTLHCDSSPPLAFTVHMLHDHMTVYIDLHEIFECVHLKFTVNRQSKHGLMPRPSLHMQERGSGVLSDFSCHSSPI